MKKIEKFTSTGSKLLNHVEVIKKIRDRGQASPISISVAPTSRCNLRCSFCSNVNRESHEDLDPDSICKFLKKMKSYGLKTVEWTGGGEPLLYNHINEMIGYSKGIGLEQGMITNGALLSKNLNSFALDSLIWVRISMNCIDYTDIEIPVIKGTLGFSYVINDETSPDSFPKLNEYVKKYKPSYVRIVPNCLASEEEQIENNIKYSKMVKDWEEPYFYQDKTFETPPRCWWGYIKPFLLHDEYVYRCSSVVLNDNAGRKFHENYRWAHMDQFPDIYKEEMVHFDTVYCNKCVFAKQNELIDGIIYPSNMRNFV